MFRKFLVIVSLSVLLLGMIGCVDTTTETGTGSTSDTGELAMFLADAPVNNVKNVYVTLDKVEVIKEGGTIKTINDFEDQGGEMKFDLLKLRFDEALLGQETLDQGSYSQIRLIVAANENGDTTGSEAGKSYVVYNDGTEDDIFIPSGTQTGLKINHNFVIEKGVITRLILDANVSEIMHTAGKSGKIILRPTAIKIIDKVISGDIEGKVLTDSDNDGNANEVVSEYDIDGDGTPDTVDVLVEALNSNNEVVAKTVATKEITTTKDGTEIPAGSFLLRGLKEGTYIINTKVVNSEGNEIVDANDAKVYTPNNQPSIDVVPEKTSTLSSDIILELGI